MKEKYSKPAICYGEILWDVLPDGPQPGGAPLNVAYHLNKFGMDTGVVSSVGDDANGQKLEQLLDSWAIKRHWLQTDREHATSEVIASLNNSNEVTYDIKFPVAWDFITYSETVAAKLIPGTYFIYGSLSSRNHISKDTLIRLLDSDAIKVFDINLRPPYYNRDLLELLLKKADIVKFNQAELEMAQLLFGGSFNNEATQIAFIQQRFNVSEIIVTKGEFGASYYKDREAWHAWGTEIKVKDTIGSGDSFLAAFIAAHSLQNPPQAIINNAVAMGAFIATKKGGCPEYELTEYTKFKEEIF